MKTMALKLVTGLFLLLNVSVNAAPVSETTEEIELKINAKNLKCSWVEQYAHAGSIKFPEANLKTKQIKGTLFKHSEFTGIGYLPGDFSCDPVKDLIADAGADGKIDVVKNVRVYKTTYQNTKDGPITSIVTSEVVRLALPNGLYIESRKSKQKKFPQGK